MEVGLLTAFLGGALSLLSPCGALLLPGFLASAATRRGGLLAHSAVFALGLLATLVPLGLGLGALGTLVAVHRGLLIAGTSILLIALGALHALGGGFDLSRALPGGAALQERIASSSGFLRTLLLGAVGGIAGFCAGPILGAVLTLAVGQGSVLLGGLLLAVYGAGMVVPLTVLAALGGRLGGSRRADGAQEPMAGGVRRRRLVPVITGLVIMALGILFWTTNGLVTLPSLIPTDVLARWQTSSEALNSTAVQILVILLLGGAALAAWAVHDRRRRARDAQGGFDLRPRTDLPAAPTDPAHRDTATAPAGGAPADDTAARRTR